MHDHVHLHDQILYKNMHFRYQLLTAYYVGFFFMQSFEALRLETRKPDIIQSTKLGQGSFGVVVKCVGLDHLEFVKKKVSTLILFITET